MSEAIRRSGDAVDSGVPISDIFRDKRRSDKPKDDEIAFIVKNLWQTGLDLSRDLRMRQWVRNILKTYSDLDIEWSRNYGRYFNTQAHRPRKYRTPLLPGRIAYFAARMIQSAPEWTAIPAGDDIESEEAAHFCEKILRYAYREQSVGLARYFATIQMCLFGFGLIETYVDEEASVELIYEEEIGLDGAPVIDKDGEPVYVIGPDGRPRIKEVVNKPGIKSRPVSPFSFIMPPGMEWPLLSDAPYLMRAKWLTESYIRRRYDVSDDIVLAPAGASNFEAMASYLWHVSNPQSAPVDRFEKGRLLVLEYYEPARDCKGFYEGKVYTVCGNHLIGDERSLFDDGRYPFFMFPWLPVVDSGYAFPWVNPQIDPQNRIDQTTTHIMDNLARVGSPNLIADKMSGIQSKPAFNYSVFFVNPGSRIPQFLQAPQMPTGAYEMMTTSKRDMDDAGMSYPLARGESQKGITSGLHARTIQDADQTEMGPVVLMHAAEFARMGEAVLDLYRNYGGDDKMLSIVGPDGQCEMFAFQRTKIPIGQRVFVQEESLLVHYRSALEARATELAGVGAFGNMATEPEARRRYLESIRDVKLAGPLTPEAAQKKMLDELHYRILHKNEQIQVEPWWNLNAHREAAHDRLVRERYRWNDDQYKAFMTYWANLEDESRKIEEASQQAAVEQARLQIGLQGEMLRQETEEKAKLATLQGVNKLAIESMRTDQAAGAGAGAAALSAASAGAEAQPAENEETASAGT